MKPATWQEIIALLESLDRRVDALFALHAKQEPGKSFAYYYCANCKTGSIETEHAKCPACKRCLCSMTDQ